ncbi:MAG TPA: hypothetical protein PKH48_03455 [Methanofastidiosum sp.]|jgi:rubrerythrin|nr:hypothetical protein [Methanofastidiosum sp.]HOT85599.1 hypothetical protein [Methanofastidiosum sp.]HQF90358.1 hypothetical protein [Methanofastidiosum sp.]HQG61995.1 hypothetical protein [Methanofastidiosum sp.]
MASIKKLLFLFIFFILVLKPALCETNIDYDIGIKLFQGAMIYLENNSYTQAQNQFNMAAEYFKKSGHKELEKLCKNYELALQYYGNGDYSYNVGNFSKALDEYTRAKTYFELVRNDKMINLSSEKITKTKNEISKNKSGNSLPILPIGAGFIILIVILLVLGGSGGTKSKRVVCPRCGTTSFKRKEGDRCPECNTRMIYFFDNDTRCKICGYELGYNREYNHGRVCPHCKNNPNKSINE